jgi:hypothetical protein
VICHQLVVLSIGKGRFIVNAKLMTNGLNHRSKKAPASSSKCLESMTVPLEHYPIRILHKRSFYPLCDAIKEGSHKTRMSDSAPYSIRDNTHMSPQISRPDQVSQWPAAPAFPPGSA